MRKEKIVKKTVNNKDTKRSNKDQEDNSLSKNSKISDKRINDILKDIDEEKREKRKDHISKIKDTKKIIKKEDKDKDNKQDNDKKTEKEKIPIKDIDIDYQKNKLIYGQSISGIDYEKLFDYMGKTDYSDPYQSFIDSVNNNSKNENSELSEEELERIIKREHTNIMIGVFCDRPDVQEKEKYANWKEFNKMWNMIKIEMNSVGMGASGVFYI